MSTSRFCNRPEKGPEASVSNTNPNDPFTAQVANENRSPLRASRTTTFPRAGTNVVSTVGILQRSSALIGASAHQNARGCTNDILALFEQASQRMLIDCR